MKFALLALLAISSQAFSAEFLLKETQGGGFAPMPMSRELVVLENGKVIYTNRRGTVENKSLVATLSPAAIRILKDKIETVSDNSPLVDLDPNRGRCMDAPSTHLWVNKGNKEIQIASVVNCKRFEAKEGTFTAEFKELVQSLKFLAK